MKTILIAGGTGLVGSRLTASLRQHGHTVYILSRTPEGADQFYWNPTTGEIDETILDKVQILVSNTGAGIGDSRWTEERKKELFESRVGANRFLFSNAHKMPQLELFVSSSGVNCYGYDQIERIHEETDPYGNDYLSQLVKSWEESADLFLVKCPVTKIRTSMVLDGKKGAIPKLIGPIKGGIGSPLGSGIQEMPWIHGEDLAAIFTFCIENKLAGIFNACAGYVSNKEFMKTLAETLGKPFWFPNVPAFVLKIMFGEMSSVLLEGLKVSNKKLLDHGFTFKYPDLKNAFVSIL